MFTFICIHSLTFMFSISKLLTEIILLQLKTFNISRIVGLLAMYSLNFYHKVNTFYLHICKIFSLDMDSMLIVFLFVCFELLFFKKVIFFSSGFSLPVENSSATHVYVVSLFSMCPFPPNFKNRFTLTFGFIILTMMYFLLMFLSGLFI